VPDLPPPLFPFFAILTAPLSLPLWLAGHTFGSILLPCVPPLPFTLLIVPLSFLPLPFPPLPGAILFSPYPFTADELMATIKALPPRRAPGPDGIPYE